MILTFEYQGEPLATFTREVEIAVIKRALDISKGCIAEAARLLGMQRTTLCQKIYKYGIKTRHTLSNN